jgi:DNA polymerase
MAKQLTVAQAIEKCTLCPELSDRTQPVIGSGPIPCDIVLLGEAPGQKEDETGVPFCGITGMLLEATARRVGLHRKSNYHILNVLKCRPPQNTNPTEAQLNNCAPFLRAQLKALNPKVVVALGKFAQAFVLNCAPSQVRVVQNMGKVLASESFYTVLSCHPRFTSRGPDIARAFQNHLGLAKRIQEGHDPCIAQNVT